MRRPRLAAAIVAAVALTAPAAADMAPSVVDAGAAILEEKAGVGGQAARALAAEVYEAMAAGGWQPIGTAPQDGTTILLGIWRNGEFLRGIGHWQVNDDIDYPGFWTVMDWFGRPPTHWAPLPAPPPQ